MCHFFQEIDFYGQLNSKGIEKSNVIRKTTPATHLMQVKKKNWYI